MKRNWFDCPSGRQTPRPVSQNERLIVRQMNEEGRTGMEMAAAIGRSEPTVRNILRGLGLRLNLAHGEKVSRRPDVMAMRFVAWRKRNGVEKCPAM